MHCVDGRQIVLDSCSSKYLAPAGWIERIGLVDRAGQCSYFAGAPEAPQKSEARVPPANGPLSFILEGRRVCKIDGNDLNPKFLDIREAHQWPGSIVVVP